MEKDIASRDRDEAGRPHDPQLSELAVIGAQVEIPQAQLLRAADDFPSDSAGPADRLRELAGWWATVAGGVGPQRVDQLWIAANAGLDLARSDVRIHGFEAPPDVPGAFTWAVTAADDAVDAGTDLFLLSVPDVPDHASWRVLAAHLLGVDPVEAIGWPDVEGLSDREWITRVAAIRDGLRTVRGLDGQPELLLERLASPALAAGTGLLLRAAARRTPVLLDGPGAQACALLAFQVAKASRNWFRASDGGVGVLPDRVLAQLRLEPLTRLGLRTEDGTAARIALTLLETAIRRQSGE